VPPHTSRIMVADLGSMHWALLLFKYFCSMSAFRLHVAGDLNQKLSFVASFLSTSFARALLGLIR